MTDRLPRAPLTRSATLAGRRCLLVFDALTGSEIEKLLASDGAVFDELGSSIAFDNGVIAAGAFGDSSDSGSVYVFAGEVPVTIFADDFESGDTVGWSQIVP